MRRHLPLYVNRLAACARRGRVCRRM